MKDYYQILEIHPDASPEVMNNAYRALVRKYHPDLYHSSDKRLMEERMQAINEAYNVLSNPHSRQDFDRRYRGNNNGKSSAPFQPARTPVEAIRRMLLWGVISFVLFRVLLLLATPMLKLAAVVVLGLVVWGFVARSRRT